MIPRGKRENTAEPHLYEGKTTDVAFLPAYVDRPEPGGIAGIPANP